jgi:very-short-patch-repair endonuclease
MTERALVLDLLTYIEQVEKLKSKPAFNVPTDYFVAYQHELKGLPGLQFNLQAEGDDVWLRIPRLQEVVAPDVDNELRPWVVLPKSPEKEPELKQEIVILDGKIEVSRESLNDRPEIRAIFELYVANEWTPWAAAERPRRKTISRYNQLFSLQQAIASEGAETPVELVWGIGYAVWKREGFTNTVKHPLLAQGCEVTLNEKTFDLEVRPRDVEPRLEADCYVDMEVSGVRQLEAFWKGTLATGAHRVNPFEESTFDGVLKSAVGHLDPTGKYELRIDDVTLPLPNDKLKITNTWVLFARKRSGDIFLEDIRRLKKNIESANSLPSIVRSFVQLGDSAVRARSELPFRGLSSSDSATGAFELYFPMPYNDEQVSIIQKLESNDGVVVQGPPGTGKTHTIANVICHYLAQGKRVLVTAKGESALSVLQEKLPERIRPLSVALLSDERDGMKQFEHSIQTIASSVAALNPTRAMANITIAQEKLNQLHAKIVHVDRTVAEYASKHMRSYMFQGKEVSPEEMAKLVTSQATVHDWLDDEPPPTKDGLLPFDSNDISTLRQARSKVGEDLGYLGHSLPSIDEFPAWGDLIGLHRDLMRARAIDAEVADGGILALVDSKYETFDNAKALGTFLDERLALKAKLASARLSWLETVGKRFVDSQPNDPVLVALIDLCMQIREYEAQRRALLIKATEVPIDAELDENFCEAIERMANGKSAFKLPFGSGDARKLLAAVKILGALPSDKEAWALVLTVTAWRTGARKIVARWNALCVEFGLEHVELPLETAFKKIVLWQGHIEDIRRLALDFDAKLKSKLEVVFGNKITEAMWDGGEAFIVAVSASVRAHVDKGRLAYAMKRVAELLRKLEGHSGSIVDELRSFLISSLGQADSEDAMLQTIWLTLQVELSRLTSLRGAFEDISRVTSALKEAGAVKWAARLCTTPSSSDHDSLIPMNWLEAWNWRQACMFLERIDGHHKLREMFDERRALTAALARCYQDLVAEKTWLGVFNNSPNSVRQALQSYLNAVHAMGAGTGIRAIRHRKTARDAMVRAYQAVPCWVLPQWRVSETIPPEVGLFDLVVIDEASQSDIWALPTLLRGKKLLVVGDHKQVSPSAVGTAEEKIKELISRFLVNQPHGAEMTPDKSIYDLARVIFAGNSVMLKEHFRCVPAIIEFSNREFYQGDIKPLRLPRANERLDPPLVDVFVKGGMRQGDVNKAEAKAIVDEIEAILAGDQFSGRSIGVVTLLGTSQAAHIHDLVSARISPVDIVGRKIAIGPPPVFQGRERDIMLISMVLGPGDRAAASRADMYQRFNVALSRARDRMYLFRSVSETAFKEDTLNGRLIRHFRQPFSQDARKVLVLREQCESGFEFEMFDELVKRGYRVQPQVLCGAYRIDFVVEGNEGRRLAIECDGDRFHGPGQWSDDMARQRVLERAGWIFWRCFASSFARQREIVVTDLLETLDRLGIEPLGAESVDSTVWVHSKEVDPYGVEEAAET